MTRPSRRFLSLVLTAVGIMLVALAFAAIGSSRAVGALATTKPTNVIVDNFPATQAVSGTVSIANPSLPVSGSVSISNPSLDVHVTNSAATTRVLSRRVPLEPGFIAEFDASNCAQIRVNVNAEGIENTNMLLIARDSDNQREIGTIIDRITTPSRVYETPGMMMDLVLNPPGFPITALIEVYCRPN